MASTPGTRLSAPRSTFPRPLRDAVERLSQRLRGEYHEDEWGFDEQFAEAVYPLFEFLYDTWWRVEADGVRHVPSHGRALLVSNHAGSLFPFDASMILGAIMKEHPLPRWARFLVLDWAFVLPFISTFMRRVGGVPASPHNAARLLEQDELVMAFPGGSEGDRQAVLGALPAPALRAGRVRRGCAANRRADHPGGGGGGGGDLPEARRRQAAGAGDRRSLRSDHADLSVARPAGPDPASLALADRVLRADRALRSTDPTPPRISGSCSTSRSRSGRRSRRSSTRTWSSAARPFSGVRLSVAREKVAIDSRPSMGTAEATRSAAVAPRPSSGSCSTRRSPSWTPTRSRARCCARPACGCGSSSRTSGWC